MLNSLAIAGDSADVSGSYGRAFGFLPASAEALARYLAEHAQSLSLNTLRARLEEHAQWRLLLKG
jgi:hypothetical protein